MRRPCVMSSLKTVTLRAHTNLCIGSRSFAEQAVARVERRWRQCVELLHSLPWTELRRRDGGLRRSGWLTVSELRRSRRRTSYKPTEPAQRRRRRSMPALNSPFHHTRRRGRALSRRAVGPDDPLARMTAPAPYRALGKDCVVGLVVQKYGGSSVADATSIKRVATRIVEASKSGHDVCVVVSAMGDTTDELIDLAEEVSPLPPGRELDMLLTAGERISMALLAMAIHDLGVEARSFTGSQAGVITTSSHGKARIIDVTPGRIRGALDEGAVAIVAGFQGVSQDTKDITTLGRGGSDTTAVASRSCAGGRGLRDLHRC